MGTPVAMSIFWRLKRYAYTVCVRYSIVRIRIKLCFPPSGLDSTHSRQSPLFLTITTTVFAFSHMFTFRLLFVFGSFRQIKRASASLRVLVQLACRIVARHCSELSRHRYRKMKMILRFWNVRPSVRRLRTVRVYMYAILPHAYGSSYGYWAVRCCAPIAVPSRYAVGLYSNPGSRGGGGGGEQPWGSGVPERNRRYWLWRSRMTEHGRALMPSPWCRARVHLVLSPAVYQSHNGPDRTTGRQKTRSFIAHVPRTELAHSQRCPFTTKSTRGRSNWIAGVLNWSISDWCLPISDRDQQMLRLVATLRLSWNSARERVNVTRRRRLSGRRVVENRCDLFGAFSRRRVRQQFRTFSVRSALRRSRRRCGSHSVRRSETTADRRPTEPRRRRRRGSVRTSRPSRATRPSRCCRPTDCRIRRHPPSSSSSIWRRCTSASCSSATSNTTSCSNTSCTPADTCITTRPHRRRPGYHRRSSTSSNHRRLRLPSRPERPRSQTTR